MLVDQSLVFFENAALSSATSAVVDLGQEKPTPGMNHLLSLAVVISEAVTGTVVVELQTSDKSTTGFAAVATVSASAPEAGTVLQVPIPYRSKQFLKVAVSGATAGKGSAFLTEGRQLWEAVAQAPSLDGVTPYEVRT